MEKIFLYDSFGGSVYRCMFAGVDNCGKAQWINITPGDKPTTLEEYVDNEDLDGISFYVLSMEGETAQSLEVAKVLGKVMECPIGSLPAELNGAVERMRELGVTWDSKPLDLIVRVFENAKNSKRSGKYSCWIEDRSNCYVIADIDGYDSLGGLLWAVRAYFMVLETSAGISLLTKDLRISDKLKKEVGKNDLKMFTHIENEQIEG